MPTVKLFASLRKIAEQKELTIAGASLDEVLNELIQQIAALEPVMMEDGQIRSHFVITINGHNTNDLAIPTAEQDIIAIFPPIAGG